MKYAILLLFLLITTTLGADNYKLKQSKCPIVPIKLKLRANITESSFKKQTTKTGCYKACKRILKGYKITKHKQVLIEQGSSLKVLDSTFLAIDSQLFNGLPVVVGVHHTFRYGFNEGTTDHFLVIVEKNYDELGLYYRFYDVGTRFGTNKDLKLRLIGNKLSYSGRRTYYVSQIRKTYGRTT